MTTREFISQLQEADPKGNETLRFFNQDAGEELTVSFMDAKQQEYLHVEFDASVDEREFDDDGNLVPGT